MAENTAEFTIQGIESDDDVQAIRDELDDQDGIMGSTIDRESGAAEIRYDVDILAGERVKIMVRELGYAVE